MLLLRDLQTLVKAGAISSAAIVPTQDNSFRLVVRLGDKKEEEILYTDRKSERKFKTVDAAYKVVMSIGLQEISLRASAA